MPTLCSPRFCWMKPAACPLKNGGNPRIVSPPGAISTLITSAPTSAIIRVSSGAAMNCPSSSTRTPSRSLGFDGGASGIGPLTVGSGAAIVFEMRDDVFAEQPDRVHRALMGHAAHLHEAENQVDTEAVEALQHADAGVGVARAQQAPFDQVFRTHLVARLFLGQVGAE